MPVTFTFGFQATPVKPWPKDFHEWRIWHVPHLGVGSILWVDVASFVLVIGLGQVLRTRLLRAPAPATPTTWVSLVGLAALGAVFTLWTLAPPDLPLFTAP